MVAGFSSRAPRLTSMSKRTREAIGWTTKLNLVGKCRYCEIQFPITERECPGCLRAVETVDLHFIPPDDPIFGSGISGAWRVTKRRNGVVFFSYLAYEWVEGAANIDAYTYGFSPVSVAFEWRPQ